MLIIGNVYGESMAHPLALTPRLIEERDDLMVCRPPFKAHFTFGARVDHASTNGNADRLLRVPATTAAQAPLDDGRSSRSSIAAKRRASAAPTAELGRSSRRPPRIRTGSSAFG
ncbi:hypothetical protein GA0074696_0270 [Micromonospora purpureochromogenes]|uniref:Uncharacterized protein n=1 Tax=Micromonospora purpureochromogenes TaxID=47872 RepID=A0A1C4UC98_9ACTN|nr:hypothetical protein [Micromonospora purpureochromogenes]SCE69338.1 hypothetical protein GA0074696_0270 [Micromonospora purpureochromogenes]